ncbi:MAG: hypothetical protein IT382_22785 [Deltaproteobacteria bacterium]|nr:hypothetical protein [Deltaproteobacteria bacterium]
MSDQRPEIQRYDPFIDSSGEPYELFADLAEDAQGKCVLYSDHLRHLTLAQIAVLEEISEHYGHTTRDMAQAKIAELRKEIEQ